MRQTKRMLATIEQVLPRLTRREAGALAIAFARRAGLEEPDIRSLRTNLENEWALQSADARAT